MHDTRRADPVRPRATTPQRIGVGIGAVLVLAATTAVALDSTQRPPGTSPRSGGSSSMTAYPVTAT